MTAPVKRAIIIGGGIGGLCTALALRRLKVEVALFNVQSGDEADA